MRKRRTARVILLDEHDRVLLVRFVVPAREGGQFRFWALPGGEIGSGETPAEGAARELAEELGLTVPLRGPVFQDRNQFFHQGEEQDNEDFLFAGRCRAAEPHLLGVTEAERNAMREIRWWPAAEIEQAAASGAARIFPESLPERMRRLATDGASPDSGLLVESGAKA